MTKPSRHFHNDPESPVLLVSDLISIPADELRLSFARSAGPGGQNVNKLNTKVTMHWNVLQSPAIADDVRERFVQAYGNRINKEGEVVVISQRYREQGRNIEDCRNKLRAMLLGVSQPPKPRRASKPTRGSRERRLKNKKVKSQKKENRKPPRFE